MIQELLKDLEILYVTSDLEYDFDNYTIKEFEEMYKYPEKFDIALSDYIDEKMYEIDCVIANLRCLQRKMEDLFKYVIGEDK